MSLNTHLGKSLASIQRGFLLLIFLVPVLYAASAAYFTLAQGRLIYKPTVVLKASPEAIGLPYEEVKIGDIHTGQHALSISGWWVPSQNPKAPAVLYLHGNKGNMSDCLPTLRILHDSGASVLTIDYLGYGQSSSTPITEETMKSSGLAAFRALIQRSPNADRRYIYGRSLGGAVAVLVASDDTVKIHGLILESTFTSLSDEIAHLGYSWLPIRVLLRDKYPSASLIGRVGANQTLVIHGAEDNYVPTWMGSKLAALAPGKTKFLTIPKAGHNDVEALGGSTLQNVFSNFFQR